MGGGEGGVAAGGVTGGGAGGFGGAVNCPDDINFGCFNSGGCFSSESGAGPSNGERCGGPLAGTTGRGDKRTVGASGFAGVGGGMGGGPGGPLIGEGGFIVGGNGVESGGGVGGTTSGL
jgi:hypothetical protein